MNPVQRLLAFFTAAANRKALEAPGGTHKRGKRPSSHPRWPAHGSGAKRRRKRKMQRYARRVTMGKR